MNETSLNDRITHGLRAQFSPERVQAVLAQAQSMFQEAQHRSGNRVDAQAEPYELFEAGWIDRALKFLSFGRWAIGRPKGSAANSVTRPMTRAVPSQPSPSRFVGTVAGKPARPLATELFLRQIPEPSALRSPRFSWQNAIDYRNIFVIGPQGSGKTILDQALSIALQEAYKPNRVVSASQAAGIEWLLTVPTHERAAAWFLVGADLTLAKLPKGAINSFFQVRHIIKRNTGLNHGLVVTVFDSHTLYGLNKNLRTDFDMLFLTGVPTNFSDRAMLKKLFDPQVLDEFEKSSVDGDVLVWSKEHNRGAWATVPFPESNPLIEVVPQRKRDWLSVLIGVSFLVPGLLLTSWVLMKIGARLMLGHW